MQNQNNQFKASSVDAAIEDGLKELGINKENADIEVISKGGIFKKAVVKVEKKEKEPTKKDADKEQEAIQKGQASSGEGKKFIEDILNFMQVSCTVEEKQRDNQISFFIKGADAHRVIGHRGETLDALQYLVANKVMSGQRKYERVIVDADFYRQKRERTLTNLAKRLARQAAETNSEVELEPMNSFERRIIHSALHANKLARTRSEGEGRERHIVIAPLNGEQSFEYGSTQFNKKGPKKTKKFGYKKRF